ncbi:MAG TPA: hypothetical protein VGF21_01580 [Thermoleophilaceae bacterium]|jgi:hypothetical protein
MRRIVAGAACLALLALVVSPLTSDAKRKKKASPRLAVATYDGPDILIPPLSTNNVGSYIVRCPRGWQTTGFGVLNGANDIVYADPTSDGRGYEFLFGNPDTTNSFTASGNVRCEKGGKGLKVRKAAAGASRRGVQHDWLEAHR